MANSGGSRRIGIGDAAPDFEIFGSGGKPVRLRDFQGQTIVLAFYPDEWNPARPHQIAAYREALRQISGEPQLVGVCKDGDWCEVDSADEGVVRFPVLQDHEPRGEAAAKFGVENQHAVFVIDGQGIVRWAHIADGGVLPRIEELTESVRRVQRPGVSRRQLLATAAAASIVVTLLPRVASAEGFASPKAAGERAVTLNVNGTDHRVTVDPRTTLLDALRERMGLTGTKKGCDHGQCGACTVHLNSRRVNSCMVLAMQAEGDRVTTIEGLAHGEMLHPVQAAFIEHDGFQCGYCTPGQIMSAVACIHEGHTGSDEEIREWMSGNICRCGAYPGIVAAVKEAASK